LSLELDMTSNEADSSPENKDGVEETTFEAKDSEKVRGQGQGPSCRGQVALRPRTERLEAKAKDSRTCLKIRANTNVNLVIIILQAFKRKIVQKWVRFDFANKFALAKRFAKVFATFYT